MPHAACVPSCGRRRCAHTCRRPSQYRSLLLQRPPLCTRHHFHAGAPPPMLESLGAALRRLTAGGCVEGPRFVGAPCVSCFQQRAAASSGCIGSRRACWHAARGRRGARGCRGALDGGARRVQPWDVRAGPPLAALVCAVVLARWWRKAGGEGWGLPSSRGPALGLLPSRSRRLPCLLCCVIPSSHVVRSRLPHYCNDRRSKHTCSATGT
jgi:hypothetical protein